jgi:hypothetical protein
MLNLVDIKKKDSISFRIFQKGVTYLCNQGLICKSCVRSMCSGQSDSLLNQCHMFFTMRALFIVARSITLSPPNFFGIVTVAHATRLTCLPVVFSLWPCHRKFLLILSISFITHDGSMNVDIQNIGIDVRVELTNVSLPPFDSRGAF